MIEILWPFYVLALVVAIRWLFDLESRIKRLEKQHKSLDNPQHAR